MEVSMNDLQRHETQRLRMVHQPSDKLGRLPLPYGDGVGVVGARLSEVRSRCFVGADLVSARSSTSFIRFVGFVAGGHKVRPYAIGTSCLNLAPMRLTRVLRHLN